MGSGYRTHKKLGAGAEEEGYSELSENIGQLKMPIQMKM